MRVGSTIWHRASVNVADAGGETSRGVAWPCHQLEVIVPYQQEGYFLGFFLGTSIPLNSSHSRMIRRTRLLNGRCSFSAIFSSSFLTSGSSRVDTISRMPPFTIGLKKFNQKGWLFCIQRILCIHRSQPKPQTMKNLSANKTLQAIYGGDVMGGGPVVLGMLGASLF